MDGCHQCYQWTLKAVGQTVGHEKEHNLLLGLWLTSTIKSCKSPVNPTCKNWLLPYIRQLYSMPLYSVYCSVTLTIIVLQFFFLGAGGTSSFQKGQEAMQSSRLQENCRLALHKVILVFCGSVCFFSQVVILFLSVFALVSSYFFTTLSLCVYECNRGEWLYGSITECDIYWN